MTMKDATEEFRTSPLATKAIAGLLSLLIVGGAFWCVRVTNQLDSLIASNGKVAELAKKVDEHGQYLQVLFDENNKMKIAEASRNRAVEGLSEDMRLVKNKVFK